LEDIDVFFFFDPQEEGYIFFDREERGHSGIITDLQMSPDGTYFITSSKDKSSKVSR